MKVIPSPEAKNAYTRARKFFLQGNLTDARTWAQAAVDASPEFTSGHRLLADILIRAGDTPRAREQLHLAISQIESPENQIPVLMHLITAHLKEGDIAGAQELLSQIDLTRARHCPASLLAQFGYLCSSCELHSHALHAFEAALQKQPGDSQLKFNCAAANRTMGNLERAESLYDDVIVENPKDWEAYKNRTDLRRQSLQQNHIADLSQLLSRPELPAQAKIQLNFALAKELEDIGEYSESFAALESGAETRRAGVNYSIGDDITAMDTIADVFGADFVRRQNSVFARDQGARIIFILGMPRTGTTLVDRLLTSAPGVASAGEPDTFARLLTALVYDREPEAIKDKNAFVRASAEVDFNELGRSYSKQMLARAEQRSESVIIDKNPMNFLYVGLIRMALPAAKIIHLQRDPMDTCYAVYKTLFKTAYPFSYDQEELGRYYLAYRQLVRHWRQVVPGTIYDLQYEALVNDLEGESQRLFEYCDLEWSSEVLQFHRQEGTGTATASAAQVRQPVYTSSIGKWKHFRRQLSPLIRLLESADVPVS